MSGKGVFVLALQWSGSASGLGGTYIPLSGTSTFLSALHLDLESFFHHVHLPKLTSIVDTFLQLPQAYIVGIFLPHGKLITDSNNICLVPCFIFTGSYCQKRIKIQERSVYHMYIFNSILLTSNLGSAFPSFDSFRCISEGEQRKQTKQVFIVSLTPFPELLLSQFSLKIMSRKWQEPAQHHCW